MQPIKPFLHNLCRAYLQTKIEQTQKAMEEAQLAANTETKSSAGDKHETGRAMMQLEIEKYSAQLTEWLKSLQSLDRIDTTKTYTLATTGALVICNLGNYYIAVAAGKLQHEGQTYFAVSAASPIGVLLTGQTAGATLEFRGQKLLIQQIL